MNVYDDDTAIDSVYDDDFLSEETPGRPTSRPCWRMLQAYTIMQGVNMLKKTEQDVMNQVAGHAGSFLKEDGNVLKLMTPGEALILEHMSKEPELKWYVPQFKGFVERDGKQYIKMQDVLLSMHDPNVMDLKIGVRTYLEDEVHNKKRRMDLLGKAQVLQDNHPHIELTEQDLAEGITKHRFMSLRDETSSSSTLGFRIQGMLIDGKPLASKYFTSRKSASACRTRFHRFFQGASEHQKQCLYRQLQEFEAAALRSEWFSNHEFVGSSLLVCYDRVNPEKCGLWCIDFGRTQPSPHPLKHTVNWKLGTHEDGYLFGIQSLLKIWSHEFTGTIPLCADDWHYRAEGHDSIVAGYHGDEPLLKGKILRLAKQCSIQRFEETCAGHPAVAYNEFVSTLVGEYLGAAADAGHVVRTTPEFLTQLNERLEKERPAFRIQESSLALDNDFQLLMNDATHLAAAKHEHTVGVELKLKWGFLPPPTQGTHWVKSLVSRFAMQQHHKHKVEGKTSEISKYCPLDLFSGDFDRMCSVFYRLLDTPQNNLRVFRGNHQTAPQPARSSISTPSCKPLIDERLADLCSGDPHCTPSQYLSQLVAKMLLQSLEPGKAPLLQRIQTLQRAGLDIETLYPQVKDQFNPRSEHLYCIKTLDINATGRSVPYPAPYYCQSKGQQKRRGRELSVEALKRQYDQQGIIRQEEVEDAEKRLANQENMEHEISRFLLSKTMQDCSLMLCMAPASECAQPQGSPSSRGPFPAPNSRKYGVSPRMGNPTVAIGGPQTAAQQGSVEGPDGREWNFCISVVDLDEKVKADLPRWYKQDQEIYKAYLKYALGIDEDAEGAPAS